MSAFLPGGGVPGWQCQLCKSAPVPALHLACSDVSDSNKKCFGGHSGRRQPEWRGISLSSMTGHATHRLSRTVQNWNEKGCGACERR